MAFQFATHFRAITLNAGASRNFWARLLTAVGNITILIEPALLAVDLVASIWPRAAQAFRMAQDWASCLAAIPCKAIGIEPVLLAHHRGANMLASFVYAALANTMRYFWAQNLAAIFALSIFIEIVVSTLHFGAVAWTAARQAVTPKHMSTRHLAALLISVSIKPVRPALDCSAIVG